MGWKKGRRRTATPAALVGAAALVLAAPPSVDAEPRTGPAPAFETVAAQQDASPPPPPPRLPRDFRGKGKWIVRDLDITVPFTWEGKDGDSQMTAGGPQYPIWFTNLIYHDTLYTLTYKWPGLNEHPCSRIPGFNLEALNQGFENARFVGPETLRRTPQRRVNHWRVGVVFPDLPPGNYPRLPLALGDIYVDEHDRGTFWQVLQFGVQNLYDPELDEWLVMDTFEHRPGTVTLPQRCEPPQ
ncbi:MULTISPECIES: hypothetical protein [unclassified Streptomyces]|uniref:hypothetical protein n=1 Tax=unclassified Streptomyces TaxID=2593676 RepID=UPI002E2B4077|nr:hypothetical protein [Streptomyces sp. NBC_00273]